MNRKGGRELPSWVLNAVSRRDGGGPLAASFGLGASAVGCVGPFSLTPALSRWERERRRPRLSQPTPRGLPNGSMMFSHRKLLCVHHVSVVKNSPTMDHRDTMNTEERIQWFGAGAFIRESLSARRSPLVFASLCVLCGHSLCPVWLHSRYRNAWLARSAWQRSVHAFCAGSLADAAAWSAVCVSRNLRAAACSSARGARAAVS